MVVALVVVLLAGVAGAGVAVLASGQGVADLATHTPEPTQTPVAVATASPPPRADDTAGSAGFAEEFDEYEIGEDIDGWAVTSGAAVAIAAQPTAVDRSIRLTAEGGGSACREIGAPIRGVTADFMLDEQPSEPIPAVSLELDGSGPVGVSVGPDGATLDESAPRVPIEPGTWYRWALAVRDGSFEATLSGPDGSLLAESVSSPEATRVTRFCMTTVSPARIHLDSLSVEGL